jgi:carboxyl-terminal processing protease
MKSGLKNGYHRILRYLLAVVIIIAFSGFFSGNDDIYFEISKNIDLFGTVYKEISLNYVDDIDPEKFMRAGIKGMLSSLDPYTIFIDENKKDDIDLITNGKYGGVGISIGVRGDNVTVVEVLDGYAAQKQGIRIGDILIEAGGVSISPENVDRVSSLVKGEPGTEVELRILRSDNRDTLIFNLIREEVIVKNLAYYGFYPGNSNNVYMKLSNFSRSAGDEVKRALKELKSKKEIKSVIFDLRGNPGGLLDIAVDISDKFLNRGQLIVTTKGRDETNKKDYFAVQEPMVGDAKLMVLINEGSASASEIFAGAIQDHDRGIIIGTKSFGKGLVQTITPLNFNTSLKITTAKYYTPSGRCIQKVDYSKDNDVITNIDTVIESPYSTDNMRTVYGAGGITPDTIVSFKVEGDITKELLAKGLLFKFADYYYYKNTDERFSSISEEKIISEFFKYLKEMNFDYKSDAEKQLDKLISDAKKKKMNDKIISDLSSVKKQFEDFDNSEFSIYKNEIIREIKGELAARYIGPEGKVKESLLYDEQFQTAYNIISSDKEYSRLLSHTK